MIILGPLSAPLCDGVQNRDNIFGSNSYYNHSSAVEIKFTGINSVGVTTLKRGHAAHC